MHGETGKFNRNDVVTIRCRIWTEEFASWHKFFFLLDARLCFRYLRF